jgi:threonine dehydratase
MNAAVAKEFDPLSKVYIAQLEGSDALYQSYKQGRIVTLDKPANPNSDGTAVQTPGDKPMKLIRQSVNGFITATEPELARAMIDASELLEATIEAPGALALAGIRKIARQLHTPAVVSFTGSNRSDTSWEWALATAGDHRLVAI